MPSKFARTIWSMSVFVLPECSWVYFTARQRSCGKVMFSLMSVHLYPWYIGPHCTPPNLRPRPRPSLETCSNVFISAPFPTLLTSGGRSMYGWNVCVMYPTPPPLRQRKWPGLLFPWSCPVLILSSGWNSSAADTEVGQWEPKKPLVAKFFGLEGILPPCTLVFHFFVI